MAGVGFCNMNRVKGVPNTRETILARVEKVDGHWLWTGTLDAYGYGQVSYQGRIWKAHRLVWMLVIGHEPEGELDHVCRVHRCVRPHPEHLEPVTHAENLRRSREATGWDVGAQHRRKTQCPQGHPYDAANTYVASRGDRHCRECRRAGKARRRAVRA